MKSSLKTVHKVSQQCLPNILDCKRCCSSLAILEGRWYQNWDRSSVNETVLMISNGLQRVRKNMARIALVINEVLSKYLPRARKNMARRFGHSRSLLSALDFSTSCRNASRKSCRGVNRKSCRFVHMCISPWSPFSLICAQSGGMVPLIFREFMYQFLGLWRFS